MRVSIWHKLFRRLLLRRYFPLTGPEIGGEVRIIMETEGQLLRTVRHFRASLVASAILPFAPILPAQEAHFSFTAPKRAA